MLLEKVKFFDNIKTFNEPEQLLSFLKNDYQALQRDDLFFFSDYLVPECNIEKLIADTRLMFSHIKVILVTSVINPVLVDMVLDMKPEGFISKSLDISEIQHTIQSLCLGESYISSDIRLSMKPNDTPGPMQMFTEQEIAVLSRIARGCSIMEIANEMSLSVHTIVAYRRNMMMKAHSDSIPALLSFAINNQLIDKNLSHS